VVELRDRSVSTSDAEKNNGVKIVGNIKMAMCQLTGEELPKKQTVLVGDFRVSKKVKGMAACIFGDMVLSVGESLQKTGSTPANRKKILRFFSVMVRFVKEYYEVDPSTFIIAVAKRYNMHTVMISKMLDYAAGERVHELSDPDTMRAIDFGYKELMKMVEEGNCNE